MSLEAALFTVLSSSAPVTALVGTRIFPDVAPQSEAAPLLVVTIIDDVPELVLTGRHSLSNARVQVDAYATTRAAAREVADAVATALGDQNSASAGGFDVWPSNPGRNLYDDETQLYRVLMEFNVWR